MALMGQPSSEKINEQNCKQPQISLDTCDEIRIIEGKKKTSDRKLFCVLNLLYAIRLPSSDRNRV